MSPDWIPISEQHPPTIEETPETDGFFLLLLSNRNRNGGKPRIHIWFGSVPITATHWARIPAYLENPKQLCFKKL